MLPITLKITLAILVVLVILLFTIRKKKITWLLILLTIGFGTWQGFKEYYRTNEDLSNVKADIKIDAAGFLHDYEINDSLANKKYSGKIIETNGAVKEIKKDEAGYYTVVLGETASMSSVRCSMDSVHQQDATQLAIGSSAMMRGICTGYNKDEMGLGSDIILNRCVVVKSKN